MSVDTIRLTENMAFLSVFLLAFNYTTHHDLILDK